MTGGTYDWRHVINGLNKRGKFDNRRVRSTSSVAAVQGRSDLTSRGDHTVECGQSDFGRESNHPHSGVYEQPTTVKSGQKLQVRRVINDATRIIDCYAIRNRKELFNKRCVLVIKESNSCSLAFTEGVALVARRLADVVKCSDAKLLPALNFNLYAAEI